MEIGCQGGWRWIVFGLTVFGSAAATPARPERGDNHREWRLGSQGLSLWIEGRGALGMKLERHGYETVVLDVSEAAAYLPAAIPG